MKCKGRDREDIVTKMAKLDEEAENREDEREKKRLDMLKRMEERLEKKEEEREARENMMFSLFTSFFGQMSQVFHTAFLPPPNYPTASPTFQTPPPFLPPNLSHPPFDPADN